MNDHSTILYREYDITMKLMDRVFNHEMRGEEKSMKHLMYIGSMRKQQVLIL